MNITFVLSFSVPNIIVCAWSLICMISFSRNFEKHYFLKKLEKSIYIKSLLGISLCSFNLLYISILTVIYYFNSVKKFERKKKDKLDSFMRGTKVRVY